MPEGTSDDHLDPDEAPAPPAALSHWSRALLAVAGAVIAVVTATQLIAIFLDSAPPNTVSQRYSAQLNWWVDPWLTQNWKLFAPDPQADNASISARVRAPGGAVSPWIDLTAIDYAAVLHDPMPSHANENELRTAWNSYAQSSQNSAQQRMLRQYLVDFVLQRVASRLPGPYAAVELRVTLTPITLPGSSLPAVPDTQNLAWWPLSDQGAA